MTMGGATPAEISDWSAFLANAIGGLREASEQLHVRKAQYEASDGWFRSERTDIPHENSVSVALAELFEFIRASQAITGSGVQSIDLRHISVALEKRRKHDSGIGRKSNPTDYALVLLEDRELDLRIEAKTILNDAEVRDEYLSRRGLLRFDDNRNPYTVERFGGMVAYVVDSDAKSWARRIARAVALAVGNDRSGVLTIGSGDHHVSYHHVSVTTDDGILERDIDVVHFVLEIDASPPRR